MSAQYLSTLRKRFHLVLVWTLLLTLSPLIAPKISAPEAKAALPECAVAGYTKSGTGLTITPSHGQVMYIDTGVSPKIDAAYVGYRITNNTGAAISGYWVSLTDFRGGVVSLANVADSSQQLLDSSSPLPEVANGTTKTVYFLVKANASTKSAQTHTVSIYAGRPDASGASPVSQCDFSFSKVAETIKAAANKVTSVSVITTGSLQSGQLITVEVKGAAGIVGAGQTPDFRLMWFSPAAFSNFPTRAIRLESVQIVTSPNNANWNNSADIRIYNERLLVKNDITPESSDSSLLTYSGYTGDYGALLTTADSLDAKRYYKNVYRFRVIGKSSSAATIAPVSQISSGTQIKHTDLANSQSATIQTQNVVNPLTITKGLSTGSFYAGTGSYANYVRASYQVVVTSNSSTELAVEEVVDTPPSNAIFTGSASYKIGSGSTIAITPVKIDSESGQNPQPYHFIGPFRVTSTSSLTINYQMYIPLTAGTYTNTAKAIIGETTITASSGYQVPGVQIITNGSAVSSVGSTTVTLNPDPVTLPASVTSGSTYLNGTVDTNNQASAITFEYGTNSALSTYTSVTAGSSSGSSPIGYTYLFAGSSGTTYYFRIVATTYSGSTRYPGEILQFTTYEPVGTPTATTNTPISVGSTIATIAGQVDPNLNTMTEIRFKISTSSTTTGVGTGSALTLSSGSTLIFKDVDESGNVVGNTSASGSSPTDFIWDLTGLIRGQTYFYQIEAVYSGGTVVGGVKSFKTGTTPQTITFSAGSDILITENTKTVSGSTTSGLALTYTSNSTEFCTLDSSTGLVTFVKVGTCSITVSQSGDATYSAAQEVTDSFEILPSAPTATTGSATSIGQRSATLNGTVNVGGASSTDVHFLYSTVEAQVSSGSGGTRVDAAVTPIAENGSSSLSLTGLSVGVTYYYRIEATNTTGTAAGSVVSFSTLPLTSRTLTLSVASATLIYGAGTFNTSATPSAGADDGTKTWSSASSGVCTVVSSTGVVTIVSAGTCLLDASISSGSTHAAANATQLSLTISPKSITITADDKNCNNCATAETLTYTKSADLVGSDVIGSLTYTFTSASPSYNSTTAPTASVGGPGTYTNTPSAVVLSSGSSSNYNFIYVAGTYTVTTLANQTITFTTGSTETYKTPFTVSATVSSGSAVTFATSGDCTAAAPLTVPSGTGTVTITPTAHGTNNCTVTASQPGGGTFGAASPVSQIISIAKAILDIFADGKTRTFGQSAPTYSYSTGSLKSGDDFGTSITTAPTCTSDYTASTSVGSSPLVISCSGGVSSNYTFNYLSGSLVITPADQTITFTQPSNMTVGDSNQSLTVSVDSGLTLTITSNSTSVCTVSGTEVVAVSNGTCSLTASQGGNVDYNAASSVTVTFTINPSGGGGGTGGGTGGSSGGSTGGGATPPAPRIDSISRVQICSTGNEILIVGLYFDGGSVTLDGASVLIRNITNTNISVSLPAAAAGKRTIRVTTPNGSDIAIIEYVTAPNPSFQATRIPYISQGQAVSFSVNAIGALSYSIDGRLPGGLILDSKSGVMSGTPYENGIFIFEVVATGLCGSTSQFMELDVDAPTPNAISHRINFLPGSCEVPDSAEASLQRFLEEAKGISPRNIIPEIYVSGGFKTGDPNSELAKCRQEAICDFLLLEELLGQILTDVFTGSENRIEIIVYWPRPNDDL